MENAEDRDPYSAQANGGRRRSLLASGQARRAILRCPACFAVAPRLHEPRYLTRCPRTFVNIEAPPDGMGLWAPPSVD
jgi:hypothetical protein